MSERLCQNCGRLFTEHVTIRYAGAELMGGYHLCPTAVFRAQASSPLVPLPASENEDEAATPLIGEAQE
jgi:hypothetical protein